MEMIVADQIIMGLILDAGDAKQHIYQALSLAKDGKFSECDEQIKLADKALLEAHNLQTKFLAQEAGGTKTEITALFVHSQDHLMTSITEINLIKEIINLRQQKAELLGYKNFAEYVLEERMAESPKKVFDFLNQLLTAATPYAEKETAQLKELAKADGIDKMEAYDHAYYAEKLRKQKRLLLNSS